MYSFSDGPFKGLSLGGGPTRVGEQNIRTGGALTSPAYTTWSALAAYQMNISRYPVRFQLNVDNLLDNDALVFTDFNTVSGVNQGSGFYFLAPRKFVLSATIKF